MLVQKFLRFVDLGRQVRATTAIGVVEEHELTVLLADLVLVHRAFPTRWISDFVREEAGLHLGVSKTYGSSRIREASRRLIRGSNPLSTS